MNVCVLLTFSRKQYGNHWEIALVVHISDERKKFIFIRRDKERKLKTSAMIILSFSGGRIHCQHYINSSHFRLFPHSTTISSIEQFLSMHAEWLFCSNYDSHSTCIERIHSIDETLLSFFSIGYLSMQWTIVKLEQNNSSLHWFIKLLSFSFEVVHFQRPVEWLFLF